MDTAPNSASGANVPPTAGLLPAAITGGFGTTVAMWTLGYVLHLPGMMAPPPVAAVLIAAAFVAGVVWTARAGVGLAGWKVGLAAGAFAGVLNLLVLGGLLVEEGATNRARPGAPLLVTGWLAFSALLGAGAGALGARMRKKEAPGLTSQAWLGRFAVIAAVAVVPLVAIGGVVTSTETGMAVPDWPNTYGSNMFLYPLSRMTGDIYLEHTHRLFGALVGLTTMTLMIFTLRVDKRGVARGAVIAAFALVVAQGVLGGQRVVLDHRPLAVVHGVTGQAFLAFMIALAALLSERWRRAPAAEPLPGGGLQRGLGWALLIALILQLALGAVARHFEGRPGALHALITHAFFSLAPFGLALALGMRTKAALGRDRLFKRLGSGLTHTVSLQMLLGVAAIWAVLAHLESDPVVEVALATAHQANGALVLALATLTLAWSIRLTRPAIETAQQMS